MSGEKITGIKKFWNCHWGIYRFYTCFQGVHEGSLLSLLLPMVYNISSIIPLTNNFFKLIFQHTYLNTFLKKKEEINWAEWMVFKHIDWYFRHIGIQKGLVIPNWRCWDCLFSSECLRVAGQEKKKLKGSYKDI